MKKVFFILLLAFFVGCGGGGGSSGSSGGATLSIAKATSQNAFKAYDAASVATYLPSLVKALVDKGGGAFDCNAGGGFNAVITYNNGYSGSIFGSKNSGDVKINYTFNDCKFDLNSDNVSIDGEVHVYPFSDKSNNKWMDIYVVNGLQFQDIGTKFTTTLSYQNKIQSKNLNHYLIASAKDSMIYGLRNISFHENGLGDCAIENLTIYNNLKGYASDISKAISMSLLDPKIDGYISVGNHYLNLLESKLETYLLLEGENHQAIKVWQDKDETVYTKDMQDVVTISYSTRTPAF